MNDLTSIQDKLVGPPETQQRRAALLAALWQAFAEGGPQAVIEEMDRRMSKLEGDFGNQLTELAKQL